MADRFWMKATAGNWADANSWSATSGGATGASTPGTGDNAFFDANSPSNCAIAAVTVCANLNCSDYTHTLSGASALTIEKGLKWPSGVGGLKTYTGAITFNDTSGATNDIVSNGKTSNNNITFNGVGGVWRFTDTFAMNPGSAQTLTVTNGSLLGNGQTITFDRFSSTNTNTRTLDFTNCDLTVGGAAVPWTTATTTNLTFVAPTTLRFINNAATGSTISMGATLTYNDVVLGGSSVGTVTFAQMGSSMRDFLVNNSGSCIVTPIALVCRDLMFSSFTGTWSGSGTVNASRNVTLSAGMSATVTGLLTMSGNGTYTPNGVSTANQLTIDAAGFTVLLGSALVSTAATGFALTKGIFDTAGFAMTMPSINLSGSNTRSFLGNNSTVILTGTGTCWAVSVTTNLTFTVGSGFLIIMNDASASSKTFAGAGLTYPSVEFAGAGTGHFIMNGSNTLGTLIATGGQNVDFTSSNTTMFTDDGLGLQAGAGTKLRSTLAGVQFTLSKKYNNAVSSGVDVQDCIATGGARWFAGKNGVNSGNNNGWRFTDIYYPAAA